MKRKAAALLLALLLVGSGAVWAGSGQDSSPLSPGGVFFDTYLSIKEAQFKLVGSPAEQVLIKNELADQLVEAILEEDDPDLLDELVVTLDEIETSLVMLMEQLITSNEEDPEGGTSCEECGGAGCEVCTPELCEECGGAGCEVCTPELCEECGGAGCEVCTPELCEECGGAGCEACIGETIDEGLRERGWRLREKVADETLAPHVRANAQKALDNMARAMEKQAWKSTLKAGWGESNEGPPPWSNSKHYRGGVPDGDDDGNDENNGDGDGSDLDVLEQGSASSGQENIGNGNNNGNSNGNGKGKGIGHKNAPGQQKKK